MNITTKNLHEYTEQQIFDYVVDKLFTQNRASINEDDHCQYRGENGIKCAAGHLIADEDYDRSFEGAIWSELVDNGDVPKEHFNLIGKLQQMHDSVAFNNSGWFASMLDYAADELASELHLKYTRKNFS
jgi:hypothetical protein